MCVNGRAAQSKLLLHALLPCFLLPLITAFYLNVFFFLFILWKAGRRPFEKLRFFVVEAPITMFKEESMYYGDGNQREKKTVFTLSWARHSTICCPMRCCSSCVTQSLKYYFSCSFFFVFFCFCCFIVHGWVEKGMECARAQHHHFLVFFFFVLRSPYHV